MFLNIVKIFWLNRQMPNIDKGFFITTLKMAARDFICNFILQ